MKNIKASAYIVATLIAISCQIAVAAKLKEAPINYTSPTVMSHQEMLTHLLLADMAIQRNMPERALQEYMLVARSTRNPEVAQLATETAIQLQNASEAQAAAQIWAETAPTDLQAQLVAVTLFVNSDPTVTAKFLDNAFNTKTPEIDQHMLIIFSKLSPNGQKNLTDAMLTVADQRKKDPFAQLAAAQLAAVQLNIPDATKKLDLALKLKPDLTNAIELNAKIIRYNKNDDKPALEYLEHEVGKYPSNNELRLFYITALTDNNQTDKAIPQLEVLSKDPVYGGVAYLTLGEIFIDKSNYALAESTINKALNYEDSADKARFYLGQLAEAKNNLPQAITWYEAVSEDSEFHIASFLRAAYLYSVAGNYPKALDTLQNSNPSTFYDQKQVLLTQIDVLIDAQDLDQALDQCNDALNVIPDDVDFLYARSIVYGLQRDYAASEKDLRKIINIEPNNANALNALGFTLANQSARLNEALPLLQKAISLNPDNPAFMDSMGWLLYKMHKNDESIELLTKAYKLSGDSEIAAHLGEVLWVNGKQDAAKDVWIKALQATPLNQQAIKETLTRLNIPLKDFPVATAVQSNQVKAQTSN